MSGGADEERGELLQSMDVYASKNTKPLLPAVSSALVLGTALGVMEAAVMALGAGPILTIMGVGVVSFAFESILHSLSPICDWQIYSEVYFALSLQGWSHFTWWERRFDKYGYIHRMTSPCHFSCIVFNLNYNFLLLCLQTSPMRVPALQYLALRAIGAPAVVIALAVQGVFRGFKDTKTPLFATGTMIFICTYREMALVVPFFFRCTAEHCTQHAVFLVVFWA